MEELGAGLEEVRLDIEDLLKKFQFEDTSPFTFSPAVGSKESLRYSRQRFEEVIKDTQVFVNLSNKFLAIRRYVESANKELKEKGEIAEDTVDYTNKEGDSSYSEGSISSGSDSRVTVTVDRNLQNRKVVVSSAADLPKTPPAPFWAKMSGIELADKISDWRGAEVVLEDDVCSIVSSRLQESRQERGDYARKQAWKGKSSIGYSLPMPYGSIPKVKASLEKTSADVAQGNKAAKAGFQQNVVQPSLAVNAASATMDGGSDNIVAKAGFQHNIVQPNLTLPLNAVLASNAAMKGGNVPRAGFQQNVITPNLTLNAASATMNESNECINVEPGSRNVERACTSVYSPPVVEKKSDEKDWMISLGADIARSLVRVGNPPSGQSVSSTGSRPSKGFGRGRPVN